MSHSQHGTPLNMRNPSSSEGRDEEAEKAEGLRKSHACPSRKKLPPGRGNGTPPGTTEQPQPNRQKRTRADVTRMQGKRSSLHETPEEGVVEIWNEVQRDTRRQKKASRTKKNVDRWRLRRREAGTRYQAARPKERWPHKRTSRMGCTQGEIAPVK